MNKLLSLRRTAGTDAGSDRHGPGRAGFTLIELIIYLVIAAIVLGAVAGFMMEQSRNYTDQREATNARETVRSAMVLLSYELRQASASDNDLYFVTADSFALRAVQAMGVMCERDAADREYALFNITGQIQSTSNDSAVVYGASDETWVSVDVQSDTTPAGAGLTSCGWTVSQTPDRVIVVSSDPGTVDLGAPVRLFRRVQYGIYQDGGRWWLGRKIGSAASYEKLAGPLRAPGTGLVFSYFDSLGTATTTPADVRSVDIVIRSESFGQSRRYGIMGERQDSATAKVFLRG